MKTVLPMDLYSTKENKFSSFKLTKIIKVCCFIFVAIVVLEIWAVNRLSTYGYKIQEIEQAEVALNLENQILENKISQQSSLINIENKASDLGFATISKIDYLKTPSLASKF